MARKGVGSRVAFKSSDCCLGTVANLVIAHWLVETKPQDLHTLAQLLKATAKQFPKGIGLMQVIDPAAGPPNAEARRLLSEILSAGSGSIQCSSIVIVGDGFRVAAGRAVATGLALLARPTFKHVVHATLRESVEWEHGLLSASGSQSFDVIDAMRAIEAMPRLGVK